MKGCPEERFPNNRPRRSAVNSSRQGSAFARIVRDPGWLRNSLASAWKPHFPSRVIQSELVDRSSAPLCWSARHSHFLRRASRITCPIAARGPVVRDESYGRVSDLYRGRAERTSARYGAGALACRPQVNTIEVNPSSAWSGGARRSHRGWHSPLPARCLRWASRLHRPTADLCDPPAPPRSSACR